MFEFFACMFLVNALIALIQWYLINHSLESKFQAAKEHLNAFWEEKLAMFDVVIS